MPRHAPCLNRVLHLLAHPNHLRVLLPQAYTPMGATEHASQGTAKPGPLTRAHRGVHVDKHKKCPDNELLSKPSGSQWAPPSQRSHHTYLGDVALSCVTALSIAASALGSLAAALVGVLLSSWALASSPKRSQGPARRLAMIVFFGFQNAFGFQTTTSWPAAWNLRKT